MHKQKTSRSTGKSYIVHIYRCQPSESQDLVGIVKDIVEGNEQAFKTSQGLLECLLKSDNKLTIINEIGKNHE